MIARYIVRTLEGAFNRLNYELIIDGVDDNDYGEWACSVRNTMSLDGPVLGRIQLRRKYTSMAINICYT